MHPRERVFAALNHQPVDRIPRFEVWIDGMFAELGVSDPYAAYAELGQDAVLMPSQTPPGGFFGLNSSIPPSLALGTTSTAPPPLGKGGITEAG